MDNSFKSIQYTVTQFYDSLLTSVPTNPTCEALLDPCGYRVSLRSRRRWGAAGACAARAHPVRPSAAAARTSARTSEESPRAAAPRKHSDAEASWTSRDIQQWKHFKQSSYSYSNHVINTQMRAYSPAGWTGFSFIHCGTDLNLIKNSLEIVAGQTVSGLASINRAYVDVGVSLCLWGS